MSEKLTFKTLKSLEGKEIGVSDWLEITQERINLFAACTEDKQWIHVDEEKAKKSPLKSTVAHGFLLLSLIPYFNLQFELFRTKYRFVVNYGLNRVRFLSPVRPGCKIRNRVVLKEARKRGLRKVLVRLINSLEIESEDKPALVAETLALFYL